MIVNNDRRSPIEPSLSHKVNKAISSKYPKFIYPQLICNFLSLYKYIIPISYMLTHRGFSAWIVADGETLPEYLVAVDSTANKVSCWIPSKHGQVGGSI